MSENFCNFQLKFRVDELMVYETEYWRWSLRPLQCTIGAGILSLKRPAETMRELTAAEGSDLISMIRIIENTLKSCFGQDIMNYIMLMMVDKQVHYHVVPRYSKMVQLGNKNFVDSAWPKPPVLDTGKMEDSELYEVRDALIKHLVSTLE